MNLFENLQKLHENDSLLKPMNKADYYAYSHSQLSNHINKFKDNSMPLYAHVGEYNENEIIVCGSNNDNYEAIINLFYYTTFDDKEHRAMKYYNKIDDAIEDANNLVKLIYNDLNEDDENELKINGFDITILDL